MKTPSQRVSQFFYNRVSDPLITIPILTFISLYLFRKFILLRYAKKQNASYQVFHWTWMLFWLFVAWILELFSSKLSIDLYRVMEPAVPFKTFNELITKLQEGTLRAGVVGTDSNDVIHKLMNPPSDTFTENQDIHLLHSLSKNYPLFEFENVQAVYQRLTQDSALVYLTTETRWLASTRQFRCQLTAISHQTFPRLPYGFYYTKKTPALVRFNYLDSIALDKIYKRMLEKYLNRTTCDGVEVQPLSLQQTEGIFMSTLIFYALGLVFFIIELFNSKMARRQAISSIRNKFRRSSDYNVN